jgi:tRNA nucleotidyltransferase (CCA-adding enzyme)
MDNSLIGEDMRILVVGGAVRDMALGRVPKDIDYVVQGATLEEFEKQFPVAKQVGKFFPVFSLDGDQYAFARTEVSTGDGHKAFEIVASPDVTLEDDLMRRDITINSMAMCPESGELVASLQALHDLQWRIIRHTSRAFADDPLRVFRVARFAAELPLFTVASETIELMRSMKDSLKSLPGERVFKELQKALASDAPCRFFETLLNCECLGQWFPELKALIGVPAGPDGGKHSGEVDCFDHTMRVIRGTIGEPHLKFAALCHDLGKSLSEEPPKHHGHDKAGLPLVKALCDRLKVPDAWRTTALVFTEHHIRMYRIFEMKPGKAVKLLMHIDRNVRGGVWAFLTCSMGDGLSAYEFSKIFVCAEEVLKVKLPGEHRGKGALSGEIHLMLRAETWKKVVDEYPL